ncbi:MAG: glycosyltransferase family 4 protein [Vicinamibacterales bacterium]
MTTRRSIGGTARRPGGIVVVMSGFPRRSETFALGELLALERRGLLASVVATKAGDGLPPQPEAVPLAPRVHRLTAKTEAGQIDALLDHCRGVGARAIHAYFAHEPAAVAYAAASRLGVPFGFSTHAKDARKVDASTLARRAAAAACVVACNDDVHAELTRAGARATLVPHGVDVERFRPTPEPSQDPARPVVRLLAVGRLVPKKGFDVLVRALARVTWSWRLRVVGDGPERDGLMALARELRIESCIEWRGSVTHETLPQVYADAHLVVVPSVVDRTGDRDGLPNVVLEALASQRAVLASEVGAIPAAIHDNDTGLLVPGGDVDALAARLTTVALAPKLRHGLAARGRALAASRFDRDRCADRFVEVLAEAYA